ncbi:MAG: hypothetical protein ACJ762_06360 [Solirubrobacteraceae bacterium]
MQTDFERHLAEHLAVTYAYDADEVAEYLLAGIGAKVAAGQALGLVDERLADSWRSLVSRLPITFGRDRELTAARAQARAHLGNLTEHVAEMVDGPRSTQRRARFLGAVLAYRATGMFPVSEALRWENVLNVARRTVAPTNRSEPPPAVGRGVPRLVAGPNRMVNGLRVCALAIYEDAVAVSWHYDPALARRQRPDEGLDAFDFWAYNPMSDVELFDEDRVAMTLRSGSHQRLANTRGAGVGVATFSGACAPALRGLSLTFGGRTLRIPVAR